ncbi:MAG: tetratricopeptide repeat protein [Gallionellaceae bacterium]
MRALPVKTSAWFWLTLVVLLSYANSLSGDFQFDDYNVIVNQPQVHNWSTWFASLGHGIRPLLKLSYTFNWTLSNDPFGFHLVNLFIHLANTYLVYRLSQLFVERIFFVGRVSAQFVGLKPDLHSDRLSWLIPLFTALLFATHPIHTEAISYISGRSTSLMTLFYLAALFSYAIGRTHHHKIYLFFATPLFFLLALATKETAITLPLALLLWELTCGGNLKNGLKQQWPSWLLFLLSIIFFVANNHYFEEMQRSAALNSLEGNLATQLIAFAYLIKQWLLPLWLNIDPDLALQHDLTGNLPALIFFGALCTLMLRSWRARPWLSFAIAWAILHLFPLYLLLPRLDVANERQMYLAGWPLLLALSIELNFWLNARSFRITVITLLLILISLTVLRNQTYRTEVSLWEDTIKMSPHKARVHNNLGYAYMLAERPAEARREFEISLELEPDNYKARYNLLRLDNAP